MQARFWVATYGDLGIEIHWFAAGDGLAYGRAIREAKRRHEIGDLDTYTYGDVPDVGARQKTAA